MVKNPLARRCKRLRFGPWVRKIPWSRKWKPTPVFLPGKSHGQRDLVGYSPRTLTHNLIWLHQIIKIGGAGYFMP